MARVYAGDIDNLRIPMPASSNFGDPKGRVDPEVLRAAAWGTDFDVDARRNAIAQAMMQPQAQPVASSNPSSPLFGLTPDVVGGVNNLAGVLGGGTFMGGAPVGGGGGGGGGVSGAGGGGNQFSGIPADQIDHSVPGTANYIPGSVSPYPPQAASGAPAPYGYAGFGGDSAMLDPWRLNPNDSPGGTGASSGPGGGGVGS